MSEYYRKDVDSIIQKYEWVDKDLHITFTPNTLMHYGYLTALADKFNIPDSHICVLEFTWFLKRPKKMIVRNLRKADK